MWPLLNLVATTLLLSGCALPSRSGSGAMLAREVFAAAVDWFDERRERSTLAVDPRPIAISRDPSDLVVLAFDRVRPGDEPDQSLIRVIAIAYTESGRSAEISDLVIARIAGHPVVESEKILAFID